MTHSLRVQGVYITVSRPDVGSKLPSRLMGDRIPFSGLKRSEGKLTTDLPLAQWWKILAALLVIKVKVKWSSYKPGVALRLGRGMALLFHDRGTERGWVVSSRPQPQFTPGKDPVPILQEDGSGRAENLVPTGIRSRTVQPIVSRYNNWATRSTHCW
jgi:hypothetical protein